MPDGIAVVDKPAGCTSHDVVARCRRIFGTRKVGHAGTLDPDATGVLVVAVGRATRLLRFAGGGDKAYTGEVVLGVATDTLDSSGTVTGEWDMADVSVEQVREAASGMTGDIAQVPPMVSALKVGGRRLHDLAREGVEVERPARRVTVARFEVTGEVQAGVFAIEVVCSGGTYVRSLAADLGAALGGGAHLRNLRRTAAGPYRIDEAIPLNDLQGNHLLPVSEALRGMPDLRVDSEQASMVRHGRALDTSRVPGASGDGPWRVVGPDGDLLAVYRHGEAGDLRAEVVLSP